MTNNPRSDGNNDQHSDALAALHGMQSESPEVEDEHHEPPALENAIPENPNSPSSTGLVGMLSKGQLNQPTPDLGGSKSGFPTAVPRGVPQPKAAGAKSSAPKRPGKFDTIGVAKEIKMPVRDSNPIPRASAPSRIPGRPARRIAKPPEWWNAAIPIMYTVASLLLLISFWAIGAVIAMMASAHSYPLLDFDEDSNGFTQTSKMMACAMLLSLPISVAIGIMATMLRRKIKAYEHKMAQQQAAAEAAQ